MIEISEILNSNHNKKDFSCGYEMLDNYFQRQANQDVKRKLSTCFLIECQTTQFIKGYYTLSNNSIPLDYFPETIQLKLPKSYTSIPTILLGRLAVDNRFKGNGVGKLLLIDALKRCFLLSKKIGSFAVIVDPIDDSAENFYLKYGFIKLPESGKMFLSMTTIDKLFE